MYYPPELKILPGLIVKEEFFDYKELERGAKNHLILARYRLGSGPFYGIHNGIQFFNMQIGHADRHEGMMYRGITPKGCLTLAVVQKAEGTLCIDRQPLHQGDLIVTDDIKPYEFASSGRVRMAIISVQKTFLDSQGIALPQKIPAVYQRNVMQLSSIIDTLWYDVEHMTAAQLSLKKLEAMEAKVIEALNTVLHDPCLPQPHHGTGITSAFNARDYLLDHIDDIPTVESLSNRFGVSYRTLETAFRSLFGMTPKQLMDILRLNRAHETLCRADASKSSVTAIAMEYGFEHLGRFSKRHKAMFGTYPKEVLANTSL